MLLREKHNKKMAVLLVLMIVLNIFMTIPFASAAESETIAEWVYTAAPATASVPASGGALSSGSELTNFSNITPNYSTSSLSINNWVDGTDVKFWQINTSSKGYEDLSLEAKTRSSGTGPRDFQILYSIDSGANWSIVPNSAYAITATSLKNNMSTLSLPEDAENCDHLWIRFVMTTNLSSRSGTGTYSATETIQAGGTSNINNIILSGTKSVITQEQVAAVTASPESGLVAIGSTILLSCATADAAIQYSIDNGLTWDSYSTPIPVTALPLSIQAKAQKTGWLDSPIATFDYTQSGLMTIQEARTKAIDDVVTVSGVVTFVDGSNYYIQDATAAIDVYRSGLSFVVGDLVTVTGPLADYKGLLEIKPATADCIKVSSDNPLPTPKVLTIADFQDDFESQLIQVNGLTLGTINSSGNTEVTDAANNKAIAYKLPELTGISAGDVVNITAILGQYTNYQLRARTAADVVKVELPDTQAPTIVHTPVATGNTGANLVISAQVSDNKTVSSVKLNYKTTGDAAYKTLDMTLVNGEYTATIPNTELSATGLAYYLHASDGNNMATAPADSSVPYLVVITAADIIPPTVSNKTPAAGSWSGSDFTPEISAEYTDASGIDVVSVKLLVDGLDVTADAVVTQSKVLYTPIADLAAGNHTATIEVADTLNNKATQTWQFNVGELVNKLYFGQLHSHTTISDGIGSITDAYSHARDVAKVDFLAVTDHSNSLDNATNASMADGSMSTEWMNAHTVADTYTNDQFVGIYAYEMTWSNGTGHINTYNTPGFESRENAVFKAADGLLQYYNVLKQFPDSISQFNHPGSTFGDFNDYAHYDPIIDQRISLIEVGNGEGAVRSSGYFASYDYYTRALDKGWHLAPTNNQDNHKGLWGNANTARTVVLAESLTRDGIYDALRNMRTYATEDNNLQINYTLNDEVMGSSLLQKPASVQIKIELDDPDLESLGKVSVISNGGRVVASKTLTTSKDTVEFTLSPDYSYYYIRVDEADQDIAVTAPIWIDEVDKAGIAKTTCSATLPKRGDKLTITSSLYNNMTTPMDILSLEYSINGTPIQTAPALSTIASLGSTTYAFDYTPAVSGKFNVDVKLIATINGVEKTYTDVLKLIVADPALITTVVVDASHSNDYVSGYYSGNMANLVSLANSENIDVVIQTNPLSDEVLQNAQMLILSPPAKKTGTANGVAYSISPYTENDIAVIKKFADRGGHIIVTALADYQDSRADSTNHSAYQQNLVLQAIGAGSRINDDEVVDYDNNPNVVPAGTASGTPYRVPMNVYNMTSSFLNGVVAEQNYSFYSGCSLTMGANATWLVKGYASTYGFDADNDGLGGAYVAAANKTIPADTGIGKGNVVALATETLPGGGKLFVAGTVFYSNFEIKTQLDNASQLQNSNYNITMNILRSVAKVIPVSTISQARNAPNGEVYCVEGIVTAGKAPADNAFFDTLYIQDATGGINLFPVSDTHIVVGQKVKATGTLDEYLGDKELRVISLSVTDESVNPKNPKTLSTLDAMSSTNAGLLVTVTGTVIRRDTQNLYINDGTGEARVFLDGYIGDGSGNSEKLGIWPSSIVVGDRISAVGLASQDEMGPRLRVRNTSEIVEIVTETPIVSVTPSTLANFALTVTIDGPGKVAPGSGAFSENSIVALTATPEAGAVFVGWFGVNGTEVTNDRITMNGAKSIIARFTRPVPAVETTPPVVVVPEPVVPGTAPVISPVTVVTEDPTPQDAPVLPKTGGIPVFLLFGIGGASILGGLQLKKKNTFVDSNS